MDALRSALQPITQNLPAPIANIGISLLGESCYKVLLHDIDLTDAQCIKLGISKALGIAIITAASVVKVPQILKLLSSKSASGLSFLSYLLETTAYIISLAYNFRKGFAFSTYGETAFILVQNVVISVLVLNYTGQKSAAAVFVAGLAAAAMALFREDILPMEGLSVLQAGAGVLGIASKLPAIAAVYQEGSTGQLSAVAVFNYLLGSLLRIFTTLQEVDDKLILYGFVAGFVLNAILAAQMAYYWNAPAPKSATKGAKAKTPIQASSGQTTATPKSKGPSTRRRG